MNTSREKAGVRRSERKSFRIFKRRVTGFMFRTWLNGVPPVLWEARLRGASSRLGARALWRQAALGQVRSRRPRALPSTTALHSRRGGGGEAARAGSPCRCLSCPLFLRQDRNTPENSEFFALVALHRQGCYSTPNTFFFPNGHSVPIPCAPELGQLYTLLRDVYL